MIGDRLRALREQKRLSKEDIEERAGLLPYYVSFVEDGETVPSMETLENIAWALEVPLHKLFYEGDDPPTLQNLPNRLSADEIASGDSEGGTQLPALSSSAARSDERRQTYACRAAAKNGANGAGLNGSPKFAPLRGQDMKKQEYNTSAGRVNGERIHAQRNWAGRGGPMDLRCPNCTSTDLKKVSLAYQEGLYRVNTHTRLTGVLIGSGGPDMIVGRARTRVIHQTGLSKRLSPPAKWSYVKLVAWGGIMSVVALIAYVNHVMASPPPVSVLPVQIYAVLFSAVLVSLLILAWRHNRSTYPRRYAQWNRSFICERCEAVSQHDVPNNSVS